MLVLIMFDGVRRAYDLNILYVMKVIEILGTDKALEILEEASKRQGVLIAREMRRKLPKDMVVPDPWIPKPDEYVEEATHYIEKKFPDNQGDPKGFNYPINSLNGESTFN